jgi:uncharacterized protein
MTRLVIDTNVLVSALLKPRGNEAAVLRLALVGSVTVCLTDAILTEYKAVLARPKFRFDQTEIAALLDELKAVAQFVKPRNQVTASPDESDNRFLECAEAAQADYLITGNPRHFPKIWAGIEIVSAGQLLQSLLP